MKLNKIWGYGQLFGFSAFEGPCRYYDDVILMTMEEVGCFRFEFLADPIMVHLPSDLTLEALMSDFFIAKTSRGEKVCLTFIDQDTLLGISPILPTFTGHQNFWVDQCEGVTIYHNKKHFLGFKYFKKPDGYHFVIHNSFQPQQAKSGANYYLEYFPIGPLIKKRIEYYENLPQCLEPKYESLYYKALSINKVNTHSPEGKIPHLWSTPDRVPHRHMWLWDSVFHALAYKEYNLEAAKECLLAMLKQQRVNGFIPHMANPTDTSDITQPCILAWGVYRVYLKCGDREFLRTCAPYLERYLRWNIENRDENNNGLLEWYTEPGDFHCKCGESGLDNSPRFDFDEKMDCLDFSTYLALDSKHLALIFHELGEKEKAKHWQNIHLKTAKLINEYLWCEEDGMYYDRLFSGKHTGVLTNSSFLPMLAGICTPEQAKRMVKILLDPRKLWSRAPVSSISQEDPRFSNDMWRGGVWLNLNYFIILGLRNYGYFHEAETLRKATLAMIDKWYQATGSIFEFYDPKDEVSPFYCERKGAPLPKPDYRKHVHSISDYNWSASFTILLIQGIYEC